MHTSEFGCIKRKKEDTQHRSIHRSIYDLNFRKGDQQHVTKSERALHLNSIKT